MQCQNTVRMGVDTHIPCDHLAVHEADNGLPVCDCCMLLGPLWEQAQEEINSFLEAAAQRGQREGLMRIGFTHERKVIVRGVPVEQNDN